nr:hypothetical protein [Tanacetum cinerariifolium]
METTADKIEEALELQENPTNNENSEDVQPQVVQSESPILTSKPITSPIFEPIIAPVSASKPNPKASIPYPSRRNDERNREKANNQIEKFYQIYKDMSFEISFADALIRPAFELLKVFHPNVFYLQYKMEECHKIITDSVDESIIRHNVSKPLPLGGPPGQVTIQSDFIFNKDLEYLRYGSKGGRPALSISKIKAAYYPNVGLEQIVPDRIAVRTHMQILSVVRIEVFSMYGYDYMKKIVLRRADLNEHIITERDFKYLYPSDFEDLYLLNLQGHLNHLPPKDKKILTTAVNLWTRHLVIRQRVEDFQLGIKSYQTQLNLTKPRWDATGFKYKYDFTVIDSLRAVTFRDNYGVQMIMRFNEIHKSSDGTLHQIEEALNYRVKEFKVNRMNPSLNTRFWTRKDVDGSKEFMFAVQKRLKTRRIFRNLESFVGGRVKDEDYRLLQRTECSHHLCNIGPSLVIDEALDYRVKEFKVNRMNSGLNTRFWTRKDVDRSKEFMFAIQKRLKTRGYSVIWKALLWKGFTFSVNTILETPPKVTLRSKVLTSNDDTGSKKLLETDNKLYSSTIAVLGNDSLRKNIPKIDPPAGLLILRATLKVKCIKQNMILGRLKSEFHLKEQSSLLSSPDAPPGFVCIFQSCNGLLLCCIRTDKLYVCNQTIKLFKMLPLNSPVRNVKIACDPTKSPHYKVIHSYFVFLNRS